LDALPEDHLDENIPAKIRSRSLSLDKLVEWPAQLRLVGEFRGKAILDVGCGLAEKSQYFAANGASFVVGLDSSLPSEEHWRKQRPLSNFSTVIGDMNQLGQIPELDGKRFELIVCFEALMHAKNLQSLLSVIASKLSRGGSLVCSVPHPFRFVVLQNEHSNTEFGNAYDHSGLYTYPSPSNPEVSISHHLPRFSDYLNAFAEAGLILERVEEPRVTDWLRALAPGKASWMDRYFGIVLFRAQRP
jgi:SAM-dependent methyltransferase